MAGSCGDTGKPGVTGLMVRCIGRAFTADRQRPPPAGAAGSAAARPPMPAAVPRKLGIGMVRGVPAETSSDGILGDPRRRRPYQSHPLRAPPAGEEFPLQCPACGGDIRLISFITEPGPIRKNRDVFQGRIDELPAIDIHSLWPLPDARARQSPEIFGLGETPRRREKNATSGGEAGRSRNRFLGRGQARGAGATGSRAAQQSGDADGSAIGRTVLGHENGCGAAWETWRRTRSWADRGAGARTERPYTPWSPRPMRRGRVSCLARCVAEAAMGMEERDDGPVIRRGIGGRAVCMLNGELFHRTSNPTSPM
jgi:hypothetical protein